jgi:hypothetical protein
MARCFKCGTTLTAETATCSILKKGSGYCRTCGTEYCKVRRHNNPKRAIWEGARGNARAKGQEFAIQVDDIPDIPEFCPLLPWIRLTYEVGKQRQPGAPSLDRIDSSLGYVPGNVWIISWRANNLKGDATVEEIQALAKNFR